MGNRLAERGTGQPHACPSWVSPCRPIVTATWVVSAPGYPPGSQAPLLCLQPRPPAHSRLQARRDIETSAYFFSRDIARAKAPGPSGSGGQGEGGGMARVRGKALGAPPEMATCSFQPRPLGTHPCRVR